MLPFKYEELSHRTVPQNMQVQNIALGIVGETGEIADLVKKHLHHGHDRELIRKELVKEIGDVLWYFMRVMELYKGWRVWNGATEDFDTLQKRMGNYTYANGLVDSVMHTVKNGADLAWDVADGKTPYKDQVKEFFGGLCKVANFYEIKLSDCAAENIVKLSQRYPQGFSTQDSVARVDEYIDKPIN